MGGQHAWWQDAVVYQVYLRSLADANGDGIGDLEGLISRLGYLERLGVDALWLNPCYKSPQFDHGYDIADYFAIDPVYGTNAHLAELIHEAQNRGIRVVMDMVANHCSSEHSLFQAALAAGPSSPERHLFHFADGRGPTGSEPPNNWRSVFGGSAWTRVRESDGSEGQWYLHSFDSSQPDFNWENPGVAEYFDGVLRYWFDEGVAGFRIDVAHGMRKAAGLPDSPELSRGEETYNQAMWDQPGVHQIYRRWRTIADEYHDDPKYFIGEIWVPETASLRKYIRSDELHQAFSFDLLVQPWNAAFHRQAIASTLQAIGEEHRAAWVLSNHDVHRTVTRYGQEQVLAPPPVTDMISAARRLGEADLDLGITRARSGAMLLLALPGTAYLYQGEELGLPEVLDLPDGTRTDPIWLRSQGTQLGRDGCRVPLPWQRDRPNLGFSAGETAEPSWLPQPRMFADFTVADQTNDPESTLNLYRHLVSIRRQYFDVSQPLTWLSPCQHTDDVLAFSRGRGACLVNFGGDPIGISGVGDGRIVASSFMSDDLDGITTIPPNGALWLVTDTPDAIHTHQLSSQGSAEPL